MTRLILAATILSLLSGPALAMGAAPDLPKLTFPTDKGTLSTQSADLDSRGPSAD